MLRLCKTKSLLAACGGVIVAGAFAIMMSQSALADDATPAATTAAPATVAQAAPAAPAATTTAAAPAAAATTAAAPATKPAPPPVPACSAAVAAVDATDKYAAVPAVPAVLTNCTPSGGDTAWMLTSVALVLMMTVPGLGLFYGGMVRKKNVGDTVMTSFAITCLLTVLFAALTYSLAFTPGSPYIGGLSKLFLKNILSDINNGGIGNPNPLAPTIPEAVYICFQMTFAIITPALIAGAFAERMKFSAMMWFIGLWAVFVYAPVAHWVWGPDGIFSAVNTDDKGNFAGLFKMLDFAGGTVVHINAGVAGLATAIMLGKRKDIGPPHNVVLTYIGAALLWVGWFGFNAGSAVSAGVLAGMAMLVTQIATGMAGFVWMLVEWAHRGKPTVVGICSGAVAGLVAITPASGFVSPVGAFAIGAAAGVVCYWGVTGLKAMIGVDDALDTFGVHALGGIAGALLTGIFAVQQYGGTAGLLEGNPQQFVNQCIVVGVVFVYDLVVTFVILGIIKAIIGLRVGEEQEVEGLDLSLHGEAVQ